jgi:CDP-glycerol glycerophosphotransferase (TagB/SpsB family)
VSVPLLSVVIPAHRVQGYVRQCLQSILEADEPELEILAIDDCSPDNTGLILDEVAAHDSRVRVLHLEKNVGLGGARNLGLEQARGDYVWFVDGDDWAAPGGVDAICSRLRQSRPDILIFDYGREYWNGKIERSILEELYRDPPPPDTFTLAERTSVIGLMMTAWNRAFRREFLIDSGLRFGHGYYEDVRVTYPTLMLAEKISLLDRMCYHYRQRRAGAITRTQNDRHFGVFEQYAPIFDFLDKHAPTYDQYRSLMFYRTFWHLIIILNRGDRIPDKRRREYFRLMSEHYRRWKPPGYTYPEGREGTWERLVERNAFRRYEFINWWDKSKEQRAARWLKRRRKAGRRYHSLKLRGLRVYYWVQRRLPIDDNLAVYAAYWYRNANCNPLAIQLKAAELAPSVKPVWIVKEEGARTVPQGTQQVRPNTRGYFRSLARAKYLVNNVNFPDEVIKRPGQIYVQTQHGTPLKTMGLDQQAYPVGAKGMSFSKLLARSDRWDFQLSQNRFSSEVWERCFPCPYELLETGYPRNDQLFGVSDQRIAQLRSAIGIEADQVAILYAPTHRDYHTTFQLMLDIAAFARAIGPKFAVLVRAHYWYRPPELPAQDDAASIINVSTIDFVEEVELAADVLMTDYSSIMFDYANLDRPIVIFANDWDTYLRTRGANFDLIAEPPGAVARTESELIDIFTTGAYRGRAAESARAAFRAKFCEFDDGHAAERVVRRVFLNETLDRPAAPAGSATAGVSEAAVAS